jgi:hypothetical protein
MNVIFCRANDLGTLVLNMKGETMFKIHATKARRERGTVLTIILKIESTAFGCCGCDHVSGPTHGGCVLDGLRSHGQIKNLCSRLAGVNSYY